MQNIVTVRNIDKKVLKRFKLAAVRKGTSVGRAMTQALNEWLQKKEAVVRGSIFEFKPIHFGKNTRTLSRDIDKLLYG